jgi:hypothetical protein
MPSFEIPDGPTTVALKKEGAFHKGSAVFGVTNKTGEGLTARFSVQVQGDGKAEWYQVQGEPERPVAAGENQTVTVVAKIPVATPPGQHRIKLRAINVNDPDNDSTDSAAATVTVPAAATAPPPKKPFPWWIVAVVGGVLVLVIGVIIAIVVMSGGSKVPNVVGQPYAEAVKALDKAGYKTVKRADKETGEKPPETVLIQTPTGRGQGQEDRADPVDGRRAHAGGHAGEPKEEPPIEVPAEANCDPAVGACIDGFVWREAGPATGSASRRSPVTWPPRKTPRRRAPQSERRSLWSGHLPAGLRLARRFRQRPCLRERRTAHGRGPGERGGPSRYRACRPKIVIPRPRIIRPGASSSTNRPPIGGSTRSADHGADFLSGSHPRVAGVRPPGAVLALIVRLAKGDGSSSLWRALETFLTATFGAFLARTFISIMLSVGGDSDAAVTVTSLLFFIWPGVVNLISLGFGHPVIGVEALLWIALVVGGLVGLFDGLWATHKWAGLGVPAFLLDVTWGLGGNTNGVLMHLINFAWGDHGDGPTRTATTPTATCRASPCARASPSPKAR